MEPDTTIAGGYRIESKAGEGAMGEVYRARAPGGDSVAIKLMSALEDGAKARFDREIRILRELRHPDIVSLVDSGVTDRGAPFLVMEWLDGHDLKEQLAQGPLPPPEALALIARIARAVGAAHDRGVIHRDIKPSNIFLRGGDPNAALLLDFGVAHQVDASLTLTSHGSLLGTPAYMAPEQIQGLRAIDPRTDVFALGCVLYECLTGVPAFAAQHLMGLLGRILLGRAPTLDGSVPGVPAAVEALLKRMLAKDPDERPADGAAVAAAIERSADPDATDRFEPVYQVLGRTSGITRIEQRLLCAIIAAHDAWFDETMTLTTLPTRTTRARGLQHPDDFEGVQFERLPDGSLVALIESRGTATDQAARAARCALSMRRDLPDARLALATGRMVTGSGRSARLDGEVIDRAVALLTAAAARGQQPNAGDIRVDDVTAGLLGDRVDLAVDALGHRLCVDTAQRALSDRVGERTPFVGRAREMTTLQVAVDECFSEGLARAVLVTGPAGAGKSRLLRELLTRIAARHDAVTRWIAHGDPMRAGSPLDMMSELVRRSAGVRDGEPLAERRRKLSEQVAVRVPDSQRARLIAFLGELIDAPADSADVQLDAARRDPQLMSDQLRRACEDYIAAQVAAQPLLIVIEDLHWGDRATLDVLDRALRRLEEHPLMVVAMGRPEVHDLFPRLWTERGVTSLGLGRLGRRAARALARALIGGDGGDSRDANDANEWRESPESPEAIESIESIDQRERIDAMVERADGNAFFLEELARAGAAGDWTLPDTVGAMLQSRLAALPAPARRILRAASVFGGEFWRAGVAAVVGGDDDVDQWLPTLSGQDWIEVVADARFADAHAYRFRHALIREVAYDMLTPADRALGHQLAADWLERAGETDPRVLAEHYERGGERARAATRYLAAAELALERSALDEALALADRGLACGAQGEPLGHLRRIQGDVHVWNGSNRDAARCYQEAIELLPAGTAAWYHAAVEGFTALCKLDSGAEAKALAARIQRRNDDSDDPRGRAIALAKLAIQSAWYTHVRFDITPEDVQHEIERLGLQDRIVDGHLHRARAFQLVNTGGPLAQFAGEMIACAACAEAVGDLRNLSLDLSNLGYAWLILGRHTEAEAALQRSIETAERLGIALPALGARSNLALLRIYQGRAAEAIPLAQETADSYAASGDRYGEAHTRCYLAMALRATGNPAGAEQQAQRAEALFPNNTLSDIILARLWLDREQGARALEHASAALASLQDELANHEHDHEVRLVYAEALHACGDEDAARAAIADARAHLLASADEIDVPPWRKSFLGGVPHNARILALAEAWSDPADN